MQQEMSYIYEVYQTGSFSKAAANLYLSQPALSISVKKVEKGLGMMLFDRSQQPLQLTEAGKIYIRKILDMKLLEDDLLNELQDLANLDDGELRLGGTQYFNSYVMPDIIKEFIRRYPKIKLSLLEDNSGLLDDKLADGSVDIMFHCGNFDKNFFTGIDVFQDYLLLAVPTDLPITKKIAEQGLTAKQVRENAFLSPAYSCVPLSIFADTPFLILTKSNNLRERALSICTAAGFTPQVRFFVEQLATAYHLSSHGLGATFVSDLIVKEAPDVNMLYYKLAAPEATRRFRAVTRRRGYISHVMQAFIQLAQSTWAANTQPVFAATDLNLR